MTKKEKIKYLTQYIESKRRFYALSDEMERIRSEAVRVTPIITDMPGGAHVNDKIARAIERLEQCADELEQESEQMTRTMKEVKTAIESVPDSTLRELLFLRYIDGYTWEQVAVKMNYNYRWILRLHGRALNKLAIESHIKSMI